MNINTYQERAMLTAVYPRSEVPEQFAGLVYLALGLNGEAGEVAELVKKAIRNGDRGISEELRNKLTAELGDVLWYLAMIASEIEMDLDMVAIMNNHKLELRQQEGKLKNR